MTRRYHSSVAVATTIPGGTTNVATSIVIAAATGLPASYPYTMVIDDDTTTMEAVEVTNRSGTTLTVTRGVDGTTAQSHATNAPIHHGWSARDLDEPNAWINAGHNHSTTALGGAVPQSSVTNLVSDLAAKLTTPGAWTAYTPSLGNWTLGNGTISGRYVQIGKIIHFRARLVLGTTTVIAGIAPIFGLPVTAQATVNQGIGLAVLLTATGANFYMGLPALNSSTTASAAAIGTSGVFAQITATVPFTWKATDLIDIGGTYEAA